VRPFLPYFIFTQESLHYLMLQAFSPISMLIMITKI